MTNKKIKGITSVSLDVETINKLRECKKNISKLCRELLEKYLQENSPFFEKFKAMPLKDAIFLFIKENSPCTFEQITNFAVSLNPENKEEVNNVLKILRTEDKLITKFIKGEIKNNIPEKITGSVYAVVGTDLPKDEYKENNL